MEAAPGEVSKIGKWNLFSWMKETYSSQSQPWLVICLMKLFIEIILGLKTGNTSKKVRSDSPTLLSIVTVCDVPHAPCHLPPEIVAYLKLIAPAPLLKVLSNLKWNFMEQLPVHLWREDAVNSRGQVPCQRRCRGCGVLEWLREQVWCNGWRSRSEWWISHRLFVGRAVVRSCGWGLRRGSPGAGLRFVPTPADPSRRCVVSTYVTPRERGSGALVGCQVCRGAWGSKAEQQDETQTLRHGPRGATHFTPPRWGSPGAPGCLWDLKGILLWTVPLQLVLLQVSVRQYPALV